MKLTGKKALDADAEVYVRVYCYGTVLTVCDWMLDRINLDMQHLSELFEYSLPEPLKEYLY